MDNDFLDPINAVDMPQLADATFAMEFLMMAKMGVRNCAFALAEVATPAVRDVLRRQLSEALALHQEIAELMIARGWFYPLQLTDQYRLDMVSSDTTVKIANLDLFPDDTSRKGLFATPNQ